MAAPRVVDDDSDRDYGDDDHRNHYFQAQSEKTDHIGEFAVDAIEKIFDSVHMDLLQYIAPYSSS